MSRFSRLMVSLLLSLALLTACAKPSAPPPAQPEAKEKPVVTPPAEKPETPEVTTLRVLTEDNRFLDEIMAAFQKAEPNVRVEKVPIQFRRGTTQEAQAIAMVEAGEVDVISGLSFPDLVKAGAVAPLDPYIQQSGLDLTPYGPGVEAYRVEGKLYQLPYQLTPQVVFLNTDLFAAAGVDLPKADWTWEDLRKIAKQLTRGTGSERTWGFAPRYPNTAAGEPIMVRITDDNELLTTAPVVKEGLQFLEAMVQGDQSWPPMEPQEVLTSYAESTYFIEGKAAMMIDTLDVLPYLQETMSFEVDSLPLPAWPGSKPVARSATESMGIAATTKHADLAWRFVQFATGEPGAVLLTRSGTLPSFQSPAVEQAWFEQQPSPPRSTSAFFRTTWVPMNASANNLKKGWVDLSRAWMLAMHQVISGQKSAEEAFPGYEEALRKYEAGD